MIHRNLTAAGDWTLGAGLSNYTTAEAAIELNIATRLKSWVGNCFWDLDTGIDWLNRFDKSQAPQLRLDLAALISQSSGVVRVTQLSFSFNSKTRAFTVQYIVDTIYGTGFNNEITALLGAQGN